MGKRIDIIPIAERKLTARRIEMQAVEDALLHPSQIVRGYGGRRIAQEAVEIGGKKYLLRVVYEESDAALTVVTAYLTSQINRYWEEREDED